MRVGVNLISVEPGKGSAEGLYLRRVISKMREVQPSADFVLLTDTRNHDAFDGWERLSLGTPPDATGVGLNGISSKLGKAAQSAGIEVILSPLLNAPAGCGLPLVVLLDSLAPLRDGGRKRRWFGGGSGGGAAVLNEADTVVVPSQYLRRAALEEFGVPIDKIVVAPFGVDDVFANPQPPLSDDPYLLCIGGEEEGENVMRVLDAFQALADDVPDTLIVAGRPWPSEPREWPTRVIRVESAPSAQWASLYQHSRLFVYAPLDDGSGVRVLEAMKAGARTVASRVGAIPEVAKNVPIYFEPAHTGSLIGALRRGLGEDTDAPSRIKYGRQLTAEYTWENCAWKTLAALKRL